MKDSKIKKEDSYVTKQIYTLQKIGEEIWKTYFGEEKLLALFLDDPISAQKKVNEAWAIYQNARTSFRCGEARRSAWYLLAFSYYCESTFSDKNLKKARESLESWLE